MGPSKRGLSTKRSIAPREFALGIESLEPFFRRPRTTQGYARQRKVERAMGIEPTAQAWEAWVLPLYDARFEPILVGLQRVGKSNVSPQNQGSAAAPSVDSIRLDVGRAF